MRKVILSSMIGNALEWYDFVIYAHFSAIIGALFFPDSDAFARLMCTFGVFAAGFLARPLGAIFFGHIGDKFSRKYALLLSIYVMAIPTALIGCLPGYNEIGLWAPFLLTILRILQGLAIGGEFTGSMIFMVEHAQDHNRGIVGSWATFSLIAGVILGSGVATLLNTFLPTEDLMSWGWRLPFIFSIFGSLIGSYMRRSLSDPQAYVELKEERKSHSMPLKELFSTHMSKIILVIFIDFLTAIGFFIIVSFLPSYLQEKSYLNIPSTLALSINTVNMIIFAGMTLIGGALSDRYGRKNLMRYPALGFIIFSYPLFLLLKTGIYANIFIGQFLMVVMMGLFFGTIPATLVEIFPAHVRFTGLSFAHNMSMALFGGTAPVMAIHGIKMTQNILFPAVLLMIAAALTLSGIAFLKDRHKQKLV